MIGIGSPSGLHVGIFIQGTRDQAVEALKEKAQPNVEYTYELILAMPCGESFVLKSLNDLPAEDTPCLCDNPTHWFVKYGEKNGRFTTSSKTHSTHASAHR